MDFRYLEAFYKVADNKSFLLASRELKISPSAVTRQIKLLEESCFKQLFIRTTKSVELTSHGQNLFNSIKHFYDELNQHNFVREKVNLKIGALEGVFKSKLMPSIQNIIKEKEWDIHVEINTPNNLLELLSKGELDIIFISNANESKIPSQFDVYPFFDEKIILISKNPISYSKLHEHTWIIFEYNTWITRYTSKTPKKIIRVNDMASLVDLVKKGAGIAMIPEHCIGSSKGLSRKEVRKYGTQVISAVTQKFKPYNVNYFLDNFN